MRMKTNPAKLWIGLASMASHFHGSAWQSFRLLAMCLQQRSVCMYHCEWVRLTVFFRPKYIIRGLAQSGSHLTANWASSAFVTIERLLKKKKNQRPHAGHAMICTGMAGSESTESRIFELVPVDRLFPFLFFALSLTCWLVQTFYIWRSPHGLQSCLSLCACVNGRDVCELDHLLVALVPVECIPE